MDYPYTDWVVDFQRRHHQLVNLHYRSLIIGYIKNQIITNQVEEERLFHLLQFLSFVKSLKLNPLVTSYYTSVYKAIEFLKLVYNTYKFL